MPEREPEDEVEKLFYQKLTKFFDSYFLSGLQRMAVTKFIKTQLGDKTNPKVDRIRPWILAKIN